MSHRDAVVGHYDERAATYDEITMHRDLAEAVADVAGDPGRLVVDVATGTGLVLRALAERHPALQLVGVDVSIGMLQVARRELPHARWIRADAERLPLGAAVADLVTCVTAVHLVPDADAAVAEWSRVLRPGGRVVTATFGPMLRAGEPCRGGFVRRHEDFREPEQLRELLARHGLTLDHHLDWEHDDDRLLICIATRPILTG